MNVNSQLNFASVGASQSYSSFKVWRGSTTRDVKFAPLPRRSAARIFHNARRFERTTRTSGRQDGALGRNAIMVLHALIFDFLEPITGRLEPSYAAIARAAGMSVSSVYRGLVKLKARGVLNWVRRCAGRYDGARFVLDQETNAYGICGETQWKGYTGRDAPPPLPGTWGEPMPVPDALSAASSTLQDGGGRRAAIAALESEPDNPLAAALAAIGRRVL